MNLALVLASIPVLHSGEPTPPPIVFETHDLGGMPSFAEREEPQLLFVPTLGYSGDSKPGQIADSLEEYVEVFRALAGDELQSEGRNASLAGRALYLYAPQPVQELAAQTFGFLEGVFGAETELTFDSVTLPKGRAASASIVTIDEANQLLAAAESRRGSWRTSVSSTRAGSGATTRSMPFVADYNLEIAQGCSIYDPIVLAVDVGTRIVAAAAPAPQGTWLALVVRSVDPVGGIREVDLPLNALAGSSVEEPGTNGGSAKFLRTTTPRKIEGPRKVESLTVQDRSFVLNTYLPEGKALVLSTALDVGSAHGARVLVVRRSGPALPLHAAFHPNPNAAGSPEAIAIDLGSARPPVAALKKEQLPRMDGLLGEDDGMNQAFVQRPALDEVFEALLSSLEPAAQSGAEIDTTLFGRWALITSAQGLASLGLGTRSTTDPLATMERLRPSPRVFQVTATLTRRGEVAARCSLPLRLGAASTVALGVEELVFGDADVEVAQSASAPDPIAHLEFDGLIVRFEPRVARSGALGLDVAAWARLRRGETRDFASGTDILPPLRETTADRLLVDERVRFEDGTGVRKMRLGDRSDSGEALTLEIEMSEIQ